MKKQFYFSFRSPYSWIAWKLLRNDFPSDVEILPSWNPSKETYLLLKEKNGDFLYTPMVKEKHMYIMHDVQRIAKELQLELTFPMDEDNPDWESPHLAFLYAQKNNLAYEYMDLVFQARWENGINIWSKDFISKVLKKLKISDNFIYNEDVISYYRNIAAEILFDGYKRGVFGIPFFIIGNSKFWGIERIIPLIKKINSISGDKIELEKFKHIDHVLIGGNLNETFDHGGGCG